MCTFVFNFIKRTLSIIIIIIKWIRFVYWFSMNYNIIKTDKEYAIKLKEKLENLGILGIKLGQYICTRLDITTPIMKTELKSFLNMNKIHSIEHTNMILNKAGVNNIILGEVIGSGSLTQVYRCHLNNMDSDKELVIKVNHPEVTNIGLEIFAVKTMIKILSCFNKFKLFVNIDWDNFFDVIEKQLNLNNEKKNLEKYYNIYKNNIPEITVPEYIMGNMDFIVMTYCEGKPLSSYNRDDAIYIKAHNLFTCSTYHTFFAHMIIHGDIHEGNILVRDDGSISIIDFGICVELTDDEYSGLYATTKFENDSTKENCTYFVNKIVCSYDIYNNHVNIEKINNDIYEDYTKFYNDSKTVNERNLSTTVDIIIKNIKKHNVLIKNNILLFFMNLILLESLSPYDDGNNISKIKAIVYMRKNKFFIDECSLYLDEYYNTLIKKIPHDILEKYNIN